MIGGISMFIKYESVNQICNNECMKENIRRLKNYDAFHCLLAGSAKSANAVNKRIVGLPVSFLEWLEVCNGGMLFDTAMLTTVTYNRELNLSFETYGDYCDVTLRKTKRISDDWFVFATAVHSDVFFFDMGKKDGKVYQWDVELYKVYAEWDNFEDWLTAQINEAVVLIANGDLEPLDIKLEVDSNE